MANFRRDNGNKFGGDRGGGRSFGGRRDFSRRDDRPREMFETVCSNCGKDCKVPFKPTSGKPVYCSDCFEKVGGRNTDSRIERRDNQRFPSQNRSDFNRNENPKVDNTKQLEELGLKLDKIIELLTPKVKEKVKKTAIKKVKAADDEKENKS